MLDRFGQSRRALWFWYRGKAAIAASQHEVGGLLITSSASASRQVQTTRVSQPNQKPLKTYESFFWLTSNDVLEAAQFAKRPTGRQNAAQDIDLSVLFEVGK